MMQQQLVGWDRLDPYYLTGLKPAAATWPGAEQTAAGIAHAAGPGRLDDEPGRLWHPDNPLFWFGVLAAVTLGLIGASTHIRVGPFRAAAAAGKT